MIMGPRAAGQPVRVRAGPEAGPQARRRARPVAGPAGDQGRRRRRRADGQPARHLVPAPAQGAGRDHRPGPGAGGQGAGRDPRRDRHPGRQAAAVRRRGQPAPRADLRHHRPGRLRRLRLRHRGRVRGAVDQAAGVRRPGEARRPPTCVLATNTSSLSVSEMAVDLAHPERVVGFHFFNPVAVLPLLEVVRAAADRRRRPWPPRWPWPRTCGRTPSWSRTRPPSWSTGCCSG